MVIEMKIRIVYIASQVCIKAFLDFANLVSILSLLWLKFLLRFGAFSMFSWYLLWFKLMIWAGCVAIVV